MSRLRPWIRGGLIAVVIGTWVTPSSQGVMEIYRKGRRVDRLSVSGDAPGGASARSGTQASAPGRALARAREDVCEELDLHTDRLMALLQTAAMAGAVSESLSAEMRSALSAVLMQESAMDAIRDETEAFILAQGLDAEILLRHRRSAERFGRYLLDLEESMAQVTAGQEGAVEKVIAVLGATSSATESKALGPEPETTTDAVESRESIGGVAPAARTSGSTSSGAVGPEFLAETPEVVFTQAIIDQAAALGNDPIQIYEFLRSEVGHELYPGSRKGAAETLRQRSGNDTDQASLLIALLRVSGVPCRYVQASISIPVDVFEQWFASKDVEFLRAILAVEGMNGSRVTNDAGDTIAVIKTHSYVEAFVPYGQYRGTGVGGTEEIWLRLDPSFLLHDLVDGSDFVGDLDFDVDVFFTNHIAGFTALTPLDAFEAEVQDWLDANQPGATVADGLWSATPVPQSLGLLPASLPYDIISESRFASLFETQRYKVRFQMFGAPGVLLDHIASLSDIAGTTVTIDYVGATPADQSTIDAFGGIFSTPPNLVNLLARLKAGDTVLATGTVPVGMALDVTLNLHFTPPNGGFTSEPINSYTLITGSANVWSFDTFKDRPPDPDFDLAVTPDALIESMLAGTVTGYQRMRNEGIRRLAPLVGASVQYDVRPNRSLNAVHVSFSAGQPSAMTWQGLQVDIDERGRWNHDAVLRTGIRANSFSELYGTLDGMHSSVLENRVFEDVFARDAVSTIKILQLASDLGIPICTITGNVGSECPGFSHPAAVLADVNARIGTGRTVTIPRDPITVGDWSGTGYSALSGGGGGYLIAGALATINGGATVDEWEEDFQFIGCTNTQVLSASILSPPIDAPSAQALFLVNDEPLDFTVLLHANCDGNTNETQVFGFQTSLTARQLGTGSYELRVLDEIRKFAIIEGDVRVDSDNNGTLDDDDDEVEDTNAFIFWVNDDDNSSSNADEHRAFSPDFNPALTVTEWDSYDDRINGVFDLMDLAPIGILVDAGTREALLDLGIQLELRSERLQYFRSSKENTVDGNMAWFSSYWFSEDAGLDQINQSIYGDGGVDGTVDLNNVDFDGTNRTWLAFEGFQVSIPGEDTIQLVAFGAVPEDAVVLDEVKFEMLHLQDMYRSVSVRGEQFSAQYETERLEDAGTIRTTPVNQYPTFFVSDYGDYLWNSDHVLVFVHGFNNTENDAETGFQNFFRKLYLSGYRDELVTYKWEGDENPGILLPNAAYFDRDVENAFESTKGLMNLIQQLKAEGKTIDIAAHSLGNLVLLDALRRLALSNPATKYVRNIIHIEAAVWNGMYLDRPLPEGSDYTFREVEQRATWDHWAADVPFQMTGLIINSYNAQDGALTAMVVNDTIGINILFRERWPTPPYLFFESWALDKDFRTPYRLAFNIPRDPDQIDPERWRSPMGSEPIPQDHFTQKNFSGPVYFWDTFSHSGYRTDPLHKMGRWYREVMMEHIGSDF